ncbi:MAG TPA: endonuclease [Phycisphaerae bacterium]|nr:endonuclease [Phycisphaerae bacterium]
MLFAAAPSAMAQTNPAPQALPVIQNWGSSSFSTMPDGFAAWNGLNGGTVDTQYKAEVSAPSGNATLFTAAPVNGGTGGCYGYAVSSNARFAILTSGSSPNGVNQLAMAIDTTGRTNITLSYDMINVIANTRLVGAVTQFRVGTSGGWTTIGGTGNPYTQSGGTPETVTPVTLTLPSVAENKPVVQIRWAVWRQSGALGNSSGFGVDNILVTGSGTTTPTIIGVTVPGSPFNINDTATVTVRLDTAPPVGTPAEIDLSSSAFASPVSLSIYNPDTTAQTQVTMISAGTWTATAAAVSGCSGSADSDSFTVLDNQPAPPSAYAGPDRTIILSNGLATELMIDATGNDPNGLTGLTYEWTPAGGTGIVGWTSRTGSVTDPSVPGDAAVTINATGLYTFTLTVTDPGNLTAIDSVTINAIPPTPEGAYDEPAGYYDPARPGGVWYTGSTLKSVLNTIIAGHTVRSYDAAQQALQLLDRDPNNSANIILIYTGVSVPKAWDGGITWNREHLWPDSLNGSGAADSDLFNLRACNPSVNSSRGNKPYGIGTGYWDPNQGAPADRGYCSRSMFYMATRYTNLTLVNGMPANLQMGDLAKMLEWHYAYPVNTFERRRNHLIYSFIDNPGYYQGNRNPFIDHPELVWSIWGGGNNNSKIYVGATEPPTGTSSLNVNLGSVIRNSPLPSAQNVTLNKVGSHPTTYDILITGQAVSAAAGPRQAFIGGTQTRNIDAGLAGDTTTAGLKTGSLIIDNTEITSGSTGQGSADGNDTINVSATVLEHAEGSFTGTSNTDTLTIDFGRVNPGSGIHGSGFSVHNLEVVSGFTAGLDLDGIDGSGDTATLATDLASFSNLASGNNQAFNASLDASTIGVFQAVYTLHVSDQNLPGATAGTDLVLTLKAAVRFAADFNADGYVDDQDFTLLDNCFSGPNVPYVTGCDTRDLDGDVDVDMADFGRFQRCLAGPGTPPPANCAD